MFPLDKAKATFLGLVVVFARLALLLGRLTLHSDFDVAHALAGLHAGLDENATCRLRVGIVGTRRETTVARGQLFMDSGLLGFLGGHMFRRLLRKLNLERFGWRVGCEQEQKDKNEGRGVIR